MPTTRHTTWIERDEDLPVTIEAEHRWDRGVFVEPLHRHNGFDAGWECVSLIAIGPDGTEVTLTEAEKEQALQESSERAADHQFHDHA